MAVIEENDAQSALTQLRAYLAQQQRPVNSRLPTERELCRALGVTRTAVRKALATLEAEGCSQAFAFEPLVVAALQVAGRDIVGDGVAEDVVVRLGRRNVPAAPADHDRKLDFIVQADKEAAAARQSGFNLGI